MTILITNLGKTKKQDGGRYRDAIYHFDDNFQFKSEMFGFALMKWLLYKDEELNKVVILGTATSMWDALLELEGVIENLTSSDEVFYDEFSKSIDTGKCKSKD